MVPKHVFFSLFADAHDAVTLFLYNHSTESAVSVNFCNPLL